MKFPFIQSLVIVTSVRPSMSCVHTWDHESELSSSIGIHPVPLFHLMDEQFAVVNIALECSIESREMPGHWIFEGGSAFHANFVANQSNSIFIIEDGVTFE